MSVQLHHGDCLEFMRTLPDNCVNAVVTDPPYGVGIASWDMELPPQKILSECLRVSSGPVVWFGGAKNILGFSKYRPQPERLIVWHVTFSLAFAKANEIYYKWHPIWCWQLPEKQDALSRDVLNYPVAGNNGFDHPAKKPERLMQQLVGIAPPGATVLDPFMGSGTTGVACVQTGRSFIGCEIDASYFEIAQRRIALAQQQPMLPGLNEPAPQPEQLSLV